MKTFKDLSFKPHPLGNGLRAKLMFDNGYGVSVVRFKRDFRNPELAFLDLVSLPRSSDYGSYTNDETEWEVAVLGKDGEWTGKTSVTDDVIGYLHEDGVTEVMIRIQELKP